jgi:DNA-binding LacI/PurR family transcriptional regulator
MPQMSVSIRTVAQRAGVSIATVSNVLNNRTRVGETLAHRVRVAVEELGYVADGAASRLRSRKQALAGVVVPDLKNPFFASFVSTLEQVARQDGFDLLVVSSANDPTQEAERLRAIRSWRPAGLIVIPCDGAFSERLPKLSDLPIVLADRLPDDGAFDRVAVDNQAGAAAMIRHLIEQGVRSCLVVASQLSIGNMRERWEGAQAAAGGRLALSVLESGIDAGPVGRALERDLASGPLPEALFALDNVTTRVAFQILAAQRRTITDEIALAGFDDTEWMGLVTPGVTAVGQPVAALAEAAWAKFMGRLSGDAASPDTLRLPCTIEIRGSTLRPSPKAKSQTA